MDCEIWTIQPSAESEGFYSHTGRELIHVLAGTFEFVLDGQGAETLHAGDGAYFDSTRQHRWRNLGPQPAVLLWVNTDADRLSMLEPKPLRAFLRLSRPTFSDTTEPRPFWYGCQNRVTSMG